MWEQHYRYIEWHGRGRLRLRGVARSTFNVGEKVLYDGAVAGGEYIVMCSVVEVTDASVRVQKERTYYLNGGEFRGRKISTIA
jgi:hypothetical protein